MLDFDQISSLCLQVETGSAAHKSSIQLKANISSQRLDSVSLWPPPPPPPHTKVVQG
jgi:hypothetical protein